MAVKLFINGAEQTVEVDPSTPLLWVIRDHLHLTGTKFGCGMAMCGACTVHADGEPIRSCVTPVAAVQGQRITSIEAADSRAVVALQEAWTEHQVPQCGYCQSGQIMSAAALLTKNPNPTDADIDQAMQGNICRCATYQRIRSAIKTAAEQMG